MAIHTWVLVLAAPFWAGGGNLRPAQLSPAAEALPPPVPGPSLRRSLRSDDVVNGPPRGGAAAARGPRAQRAESASGVGGAAAAATPATGHRRKR